MPWPKPQQAVAGTENTESRRRKEIKIKRPVKEKGRGREISESQETMDAEGRERRGGGGAGRNGEKHIEDQKNVWPGGKKEKLRYIKKEERWGARERERRTRRVREREERARSPGTRLPPF